MSDGTEVLKYVNPLGQDSPTDGDSSPTRRYADFEHDLSNDDLGVLTFTFQAWTPMTMVDRAARVARDGVDPAGPEAEVTMDGVRALFVETKREFRTWVDA